MIESSNLSFVGIVGAASPRGESPDVALTSSGSWSVGASFMPLMTF